jgi:predicted DNA-binding transcriptional regulator AlpA
MHPVLVIQQIAVYIYSAVLYSSDGDAIAVLSRIVSDLPSDWWSTADVASYLRVSESTIRSYVAREQMPKPDRRIGSVGVWRPATIRKWDAQRPRRGGGHTAPA